MFSRRRSSRRGLCHVIVLDPALPPIGSSRRYIRMYPLKRKSSRAKPPRRARRAPGHRTHAAEHRHRPAHPRQVVFKSTRPTIPLAPDRPRARHRTGHRPARTPVNSNPAQRVRRSRDGSRLANPHRQANLRRRGEMHRDGDALHHTCVTPRTSLVEAKRA